MHSTDNLEDGYIGSGKRLWNSINRYGKDKFKCVIIEFLPNRISLKEREKELVNEDILKDKMCMNLQPGGGGGFINEEHRKKFHAAGGRAVRKILANRHQEKMKTDQVYRNRVVTKLKECKTFLGKKHKDSSKKKIGEANSIKQKGESNSQFGTCWITNGVENKKIYKGDVIPIDWKIGRTIKITLK